MRKKGNKICKTRDYKDFFWLHIKKSAGTSTRKLLYPYYNEVERAHKPKNFIQASPYEYNDILNNFRVVLGEFQFKRALFAKEFLYPNEWNSKYSFAFSREPIDRCLSMFYYLHHKKKSYLRLLWDANKNLKAGKRLGFSVSYDFDLFLELIDSVSHYDCTSIYKPAGLHFSTHTAPMFSDVTDFDGNILLTRIFRLELLHEAIEEVYNSCGLKYESMEIPKMNKNTSRRVFIPSKNQRKKIYELYADDFDLYENGVL